MTHHDPAPGHHHDHEDAIEPTTPFDEVTDLLDEEDLEPHDDERVRIEHITMPPPRTLLFLLAMVLSPLFALAFGLNAALFALVLAMAATTWLVWDGARRFVPEQAALLRRAALANAVVGLMALALLLIRMLG